MRAYGSSNGLRLKLYVCACIEQKGVIGQNVLVKTAVVVEISTATAVISFLKEDTGWTKRVGKIVCNP